MAILKKRMFIFLAVKTILVLSLFVMSTRSLYAIENPVPLFSIGGGRLFAGPNHSGGIVQCEYKWGKYWCGHIRPQVTFAIPEMRSIFFGVGLAWEYYLTRKIVFSPNFSPGLYHRGEGRDLGYPLEFRSALEAAYEFNNSARIGTQFYHISNGSLSDRNPGENAWVIFIAFPFHFGYR